MKVAICANDGKAVLTCLTDYLKDGKTIKGLRSIDSTEGQLALLIDDKPIPDEMAEAYWAGYMDGMGCALQ